MKKVLYSVFFSTLLLFAGSTNAFSQSFTFSERNYVEGNIKVAGIGELPQGYFAKAAGYLPGDIIKLTSSITGETIELLNLGAPDSGDSTVLLISKEAAAFLGITERDNLNIRLNERSGNLEESVSSQALAVRGSGTPYSPQETAVQPSQIEEPQEEYNEDVSMDETQDFDSFRATLETPSPAEVSEKTDKSEVKQEENNTESQNEQSEEQANETESIEESVETSVEEENSVEEEKFEDDMLESESVDFGEFIESNEKEEIPDVTETEKYEDEDAENVNAIEPDSFDTENNGNNGSTESEAIDDGYFEEAAETVDHDKNGENVLNDGENPDEPEADLTIPEPLYELKNNEKVEAEPVEEYSAEEDSDGENVDSNEEQEGELENESSKEELVEEPVEEYIDEEIPGEEVVEEEPYEAENDLSGEDVAASEPEDYEEETEVEPDVPYVVEEDLTEENVESTEPEDGEIEVEEYSVEEDLLGEEVESAENTEGEIDEVEESVVEEVEEIEPYEVETDLEGEEVAAFEPTDYEEELESESSYVAEEDLSGETVDSNEDSSATEEDLAGENVEAVETIAEEETDMSYAPIVLIPAESVTPQDKDDEKPEILQIVPVPVEEETETKVVETPVVTKPAASQNEIVASHTVTMESIKTSDYYIQIATLSDEFGIASIIEQYSKYDIVVVKNEGSSTYKVLVGPLTVDEYGVILTRFKSYGFKDAFVFKKK